jgi:hypothetical protein
MIFARQAGIQNRNQKGMKKQTVFSYVSFKITNQNKKRA